jgi:hypothetical protein
MGIPNEEEKHAKASSKEKEKVVEEEDIEKVKVETIDSNYEDDDENIWGETCLMMSQIDFYDYEACDIVVHGAESEEENFPSLGKLFYPKEEGERSKSKTANYKAVLRSDAQIPERQAPKEASKGKDKALEKNKDINPIDKSSDKARLVAQEYNIMDHLRKIPALLSIFDALIMSQELRDVLICTLQNPEQYKSYFADKSLQEALYISGRMAGINFTDEDLLIGTADHNRPMFITGECEGQKLNRILIDAGSSINIMPLKTLKTLTLDIKLLSNEKVTIHRFNQNSQRELGAVNLVLNFGAFVRLFFARSAPLWR